MALVSSIMAWWGSHSAILAGIFLALWGVCEALVQIPSIKANSAFQAAMNGIKFILEKVFGKLV